MKNNRQELIDWFINNDELVKDIIRITNKQIEGVDREFWSEARDQQLDEIGRKLSDEIGSTLGLTVEALEDIMDRETLKKIMEAYEQV